MAIHNHSSWPLDTIVSTFPRLGHMENKWRGRRVDLYAHPEDEHAVVTVGTAYDGSTIVITVDPRATWALALDYAAHGRVYIYE